MQRVTHVPDESLMSSIRLLPPDYYLFGNVTWLNEPIPMSTNIKFLKIARNYRSEHEASFGTYA